MHRFFCPNLGDANAALSATGAEATAHLDPEETHHARRVLRLNEGDAVELFDGRGRVAQGAIESWSQGAVVRVGELRHVPPPRPALDLAVAIPKGPRADEMVNQLSQLGADRLMPLKSERSVVDPRRTKLDKFHRLAVESAKQCRRAHLMAVAPPAALEAILREPYDLRLIAAPGADPPADLPQRLGAAERVLVLIGPEGGWTQEELAAARSEGALPWPLGPHVLRIETAAVAAAAILRYFAAGR